MNFVATGMLSFSCLLCIRDIPMTILKHIPRTQVLTMHRTRDNSQCAHMGNLRLGHVPPHDQAAAC